MDALIRIDAHGSRIGEPERPAGQHPILEETANETFAEFDLQGLRKPPLRHIEDEENPRDQEEHAELEEKVPQVAARQRIEEWFVPAVEANLPVGSGNDDENDG